MWAFRWSSRLLWALFLLAPVGTVWANLQFEQEWNGAVEIPPIRAGSSCC